MRKYKKNNKYVKRKITKKEKNKELPLKERFLFGQMGDYLVSKSLQKINYFKKGKIDKRQFHQN